MERLWIREVRRAARRASAPFARQVALGCGAAAVGTMAASLLPLESDGTGAKALWAAVWAVAGYVAIWQVGGRRLRPSGVDARQSDSLPLRSQP